VRIRVARHVRELVNLCRRLTVLAPGNEIRAEDLPRRSSAQSERTGRAGLDRRARHLADRQALSPPRPLLDDALPAFERTLIRVALRHTQGHRQERKALGWAAIP